MEQNGGEMRWRRRRRGKGEGGGAYSAAITLWYLVHDGGDVLTAAEP